MKRLQATNTEQATAIQHQDIISNLKRDISTLLLRLRMNKQSEGVNFHWTSPNLEAIPRWSITNDGAAFSLQETLITPGLDTTTTITRQINTSTTTETTTTFGQ